MDPTDNFDPDEYLHRYLKSGWVLQNGEVDPETWDLPQVSVDRCSHSAVGLPALGPVAELTVVSLPEKILNNGVWELRPVYCPENGNMAHSEIRMFQDGVCVLKKGDSMWQKRLRKEFRSRLSSRFKVVRVD
jgi:hypothetical protein